MLSIAQQKNSDINLNNVELFNEDSSEIITQQSLLLTTSQEEKQEKACPRLSMVWVKEFDGTRERLVAKWVTED